LGTWTRLPRSFSVIARRVRNGVESSSFRWATLRRPFPTSHSILEARAIQQFARALSRELGPHNITVNVPSPGFTDTDMIPDEYHAFGANLLPFNRVGTPKDGQTLPPFSRATPSAVVNRTKPPGGAAVWRHEHTMRRRLARRSSRKEEPLALEGDVNIERVPF
jgi:hypothetical protein